jgi:PERQ amino acid-rich with GYF domain-containing protein
VADVMQKWYEGGYFTPDLLMKRTHTDNDWIPVGELERRVGGVKIFLSLPFVSSAPPGFSGPPEPPVQSFTISHDQAVYNSPNQSIPARSLRTSTLDSYLGSTSNPSDSPSSSFAGRFSNGSPDPSAFGGRVSGNIYTADHAIGGRVSSFTAPSQSFSTNRGTFGEPPQEPPLAAPAAGFGNTVPSRASSVDSYAFNGSYTVGQTTWLSHSVDPVNPGFDNDLTAEPMTTFPTALDAPQACFSSGSSTYLDQPGAISSDRGQGVPFGDHSTLNAGSTQNDFIGMGTQMTPSQILVSQNSGFSNSANGSRTTAFNGQSQQSYSHSPSLQYTGASQHPVVSLQTNTPLNHDQQASVPPQSPWATVEPAPVRRLGPFDTDHPKTTNMVIKRSVTPSQHPSPWGTTSTISPQPSQTHEASPWYSASRGGTADEGWREVPGPNSLTFDNVGAHNQQHETSASDGHTLTAATPTNPPLMSPAEILPQHVAEPIPPVSPAFVSPPTIPKSKRKSAPQQNQTAVPAFKSQSNVPPVSKDPSPPPAQSKPAWATEEDAKKTRSSVGSLGLREIQEAEAKKIEARRAAERERVARSVISTSPVTEDPPQFTASWGLPTSRAGTRSDMPPKDGAAMTSPNPPASNPPVWTNTGKAPQTKKTMKEIQEEEERRKKMAVKETIAAAAAARRGYADTTNKVSTSAKLSAAQIAHFSSRVP